MSEGTVLAQENQPAPSTFRNVINGALLFAIVGPPLGGLTIGLISLAIELTKMSFTEFVTSFLFTFILVLFSYPVAVIPAAIVGVIAGIYRHKLVDWSASIFVGILSIVAVQIFLYLILPIFLSPYNDKSEAIFNLGFSFALPSFVAGIVVSRIFGKAKNQHSVAVPFSL